MSSRYRRQSESQIYHVTVRGVAKQIIFEGDEDRRFFGENMRQCLRQYEADLYAWCFMSNHVHLLVRADIEQLSCLMRKLLTSYAKYFNAKYERTGHLFQGRFDSVPIDTDEQLIAAVRYIHRNPHEKPRQRYDRYKWSSYQEYLRKPFITKTNHVMTYFSNLDEFVRFHESWKQDDHASEPSKIRKVFSDEAAIDFAKELLAIDSVTAIASCGKTERDKRLVALKNAGLSIGQIARITGIGRNIVQRAGK